MSPHTGTQLTLPGGRVFVRETGEGPPLLLINGLGAHTAMWECLERALPGRRIVEFDLPGAGQSRSPGRAPSIRQLARLAAAVMDHFGMRRGDVLGYSMGGMVAQQLASDLPHRVRRLVLVATTPGIGAVQGELMVLLNILTPARYSSPRLWASTIGTLAGGRARHDKEWVAQQGRMRLHHQPTWRGYVGQLSSMSRWSGLPLLAGITCPALVVCGDDDPLAPMVNSMMMAHLLPNGRLLVLPREGHLLVMDDQSRCHSAIRDYLDAVDLSRSDVWSRAGTVSVMDLHIALRAIPRQAPPLSVLNALARRRWLGARVLPDQVLDRGEPRR